MVYIPSSALSTPSLVLQRCCERERLPKMVKYAREPENATKSCKVGKACRPSSSQKWRRLHQPWLFSLGQMLLEHMRQQTLNVAPGGLASTPAMPAVGSMFGCSDQLKEQLNGSRVVRLC